ncbi:unnamed protein product [Moneuplotes crassus]|uniref:Uncharacterized protein n=1 Tax=Euplotes crassus TaxID=5936 RepID=A0AAD1XZH6_EUPCR|nr:unnamed protein product [Moneuplotes crassus]
MLAPQLPHTSSTNEFQPLVVQISSLNLPRKASAQYWASLVSRFGILAFVVQ